MIQNIDAKDSMSFRVLKKLYLGTGDELSQGSSVFAENNAVDKNTFVTTIGVSCDTFFHQLKLHIEELYDDYMILLRLNCEGMEDEVIYSVHNIFGPKTAMIFGSLNDVKRVRGLNVSKELNKFMNDKKLPFVFFCPLIYSWPKAHMAIMNLLDKTNLNLSNPSLNCKPSSFESSKIWKQLFNLFP